MAHELRKQYDDESIRAMQATSISNDSIDLYVDHGDNIPEYNVEGNIDGANNEGANGNNNVGADDERDLALSSDDSDGLSTDEYIEARKKSREYKREVKENGETNALEDSYDLNESENEMGNESGHDDENAENAHQPPNE